MIPFPFCELQSKWLAGILSGRIDLPSEEEMIRDVKADYKEVKRKGWPKRYTHNISDVQVPLYVLIRNLINFSVTSNRNIIEVIYQLIQKILFFLINEIRT